MATQFSVLAWRIPGMAEPGGLTSMESHRVRHYWNDLAAAAAIKFFKLYKISILYVNILNLIDIFIFLNL